MSWKSAIRLAAVTSLLALGSTASADTPSIYCEQAPFPILLNFCISTDSFNRTSAGLGNLVSYRVSAPEGHKMRVELVFRAPGVPFGQEQIVAQGPNIDGIDPGGRTRTGNVAWWHEGTFCARMYVDSHVWVDWACIYNFPGGWRPDPSSDHLS